MISLIVLKLMQFALIYSASRKKNFINFKRNFVIQISKKMKVFKFIESYSFLYMYICIIDNSILYTL